MASSSANVHANTKGNPSSFKNSVDEPIEEEIIQRQATISLIVATSETVNWLFFILGCSVLIPWNAIITAMPFFTSRMEGTPFKAIFASYLAAGMQISRLPSLAHATYTVKRASKTRRIRVSSLTLTVLIASLTLSTYVHPSSKVFFGFALTNGILQSMVNSYYGTSIIAIASYFGPPAIQSMFSGQAAIAVVISAVQLLSTVSSVSKEKPNAEIKTERSSVDRAATLFFLAMMVASIGALFAHTYLIRLSIYKEISAVFEGRDIPPRSEETPLLVNTEGVLEPTSHVDANRVFKVLRKNWTYNLAVFFNFFITLTVFPAITTAIQSVHSPSYSLLSNPLIFSGTHFLVFNLGDWIGRWLCNFPLFQVWSGKQLLLLSFSRVIYIPLFLGCNIVGAVRSSASPLINSDLVFFVILLLFGITNGHHGSLCMMAAGSLVHNLTLRKDDVDVAAVIASFCLSGGLTLGSIANFGVRGLICQCNPFIQ